MTTQTQYYSGSGFYISDDGYIATSAHLIEKCSKDKIYILNNDADNTKKKLKYIAIDRINDIAILKSPHHNHTHIIFSKNPNSLQKDDMVYIAGYPHKKPVLDFKKARFEKYQKYRSDEQIQLGIDQIQTSLLFDNVADYGNSGGALLNQSGHLIGIVQGMASITEYGENIQTKTKNLSIAVPTHKLEHLMYNYGIILDKQNSFAIRNYKTIQKQANNYMVMIICR